MKKEKSCGAVVYKIINNQIFFLIEKMQRGHFSIPKGHVENNETEIETALREIKEETNLDVLEDDLELIKLVSGMSRLNSYPNGDVVVNNTAFYLVKKYSGELKWDSESKEMKFFALDNLPENLHDPDLIEEYKKYVKKKKMN